MKAHLLVKKIYIYIRGAICEFSSHSKYYDVICDSIEGTKVTFPSCFKPHFTLMMRVGRNSIMFVCIRKIFLPNFPLSLHFRQKCTSNLFAYKENGCALVTYNIRQFNLRLSRMKFIVLSLFVSAKCESKCLR